jgi:hypothetical protein
MCSSTVWLVLSGRQQPAPRVTAGGQPSASRWRRPHGTQRPAWLVAAGSRPSESRPRPTPRDAAAVAPHTELERTPRGSRRGGSRTDLGSSWIGPRARVWLNTKIRFRLEPLGAAGAPTSFITAGVKSDSLVTPHRTKQLLRFLHGSEGNRSCN